MKMIAKNNSACGKDAWTKGKAYAFEMDETTFKVESDSGVFERPAFLWERFESGFEAFEEMASRCPVCHSEDVKSIKRSLSWMFECAECNACKEQFMIHYKVTEVQLLGKFDINEVGK